jgi:molybdate transport system substrate-binding protein
MPGVKGCTSSSVAQKVVDRSADVALHQISEILAVPGAVLVGPIPAEIQNYTVYAAAASATVVGTMAILYGAGARPVTQSATQVSGGGQWNGLSWLVE